MNTRILMNVSAVFMLICGLLLQFFPHEVLARLGPPSSGIAPIFLQLAGALYLGFAFMNWMAKAVLIGGIYARPLAIGNLAHFLIGALALTRYAYGASSAAVWALTAVYAAFAAAFGYIFFKNPAKKMPAAD
jgi:hypothetical protein